MKPNMLAATMMAALASGISNISGNTSGNTYRINNYSDDDLLEDFLRPKRRIKVTTKCLLKGCEVMTSHNGGYCCAKHCKLDRERRNAIKKVQHDTFTNLTGSLPE